MSTFPIPTSVVKAVPLADVVQDLLAVASLDAIGREVDERIRAGKIHALYDASGVYRPLRAAELRAPGEGMYPSMSDLPLLAIDYLKGTIWRPIRNKAAGTVLYISSDDEDALKSHFLGDGPGWRIVAGERQKIWVQRPAVVSEAVRRAKEAGTVGFSRKALSRAMETMAAECKVAWKAGTLEAVMKRDVGGFDYENMW